MDIDELIEQILVDVHGEDEGMVAFSERFRGNVHFPSDNQGIRFLLDEVKRGMSWDDSTVI